MGNWLSQKLRESKGKRGSADNCMDSLPGANEWKSPDIFGFEGAKVKLALPL